MNLLFSVPDVPREVIVCQTCGDLGFSVALIYCDKCQAYAVHRYCLPKLPKTFVEHVVWFCIDCEPKVVESSSHQHAVPATGPQSRVDSIVGKSKGKNGIKLKKKKKKKRKRKKIEYNCGSLAESNVQRQGSQTPRGSSIVVGPSSSKEAGHTEAKTSPSNSCSYSDDVVGRIHVVDTSNQIPRNIYVPAQPIFESIWRGSFDIFVENITIEAVAHLSSLACLKVCDTAKCLPQLLHLELLPRCDVWPKGFKKSGPSDESIALYFFPSNEREVKIFNNLIDKMIDKDLGIRAVVEDVELLVYTSNLLPMNFERFQGNLYLWGAFRAKQPSHHGEENSCATALTLDSCSPISPLSENGSSLFGYGNS
ncbi:hypothetical protein HRI_001378300 [Hibiscus trionum]|uniref:Zinc finger PHD-type domain-containing protein n=1 Tax=Hibiscus trionum TaxID=183268 RepID=A0A9W7LVY0_HIBTR|nr:hypothetical protein HRI_001378300 [Hibiscus trionum]